jgi:hypothetical protein
MNISRHILNEALDLSLEWEHNPAEKLSVRIRGLFPELSKQESSDIEKICKDVKRHALEKAKIAQSQQELSVLISDRYNFISQQNLEHISRQAWFWVPK